MEYSSFAKPPGQRITSSSLPSSAASTSTSSTAVKGTSSPTFNHAATPRLPAPTGPHSPPAQHGLGRDSLQKVLPHRSVYSRLRRHYNQGIWRWLLVLVVFFVSLQLYVHLRSHRDDTLKALDLGWASEIPHLNLVKKKHDPIRWLRDNSYANDLKESRPKAALISLVRNEELDGILQSMRQLEFHWNGRYNYPWVFFNERPFSEEFKVRLFLIRNSESLTLLF